MFEIGYISYIILHFTKPVTTNVASDVLLVTGSSCFNSGRGRCGGCTSCCCCHLSLSRSPCAELEKCINHVHGSCSKGEKLKIQQEHAMHLIQFGERYKIYFGQCCLVYVPLTNTDFRQEQTTGSWSYSQRY